MRDKLGIFFSGLCICHCLLVPVLVVLVEASQLMSLISSEWIHFALLLPILVLLLSSVPKTYKRTQDRRLIVLSVSGLTAIIAALFFHGPIESMLTVLGSLNLIAAHFISLSYTPRLYKKAAA